MKCRIVWLVLLVACLATIPAVAQDLRNNAVLPTMAPTVASPPGPCNAGDATPNGTLNGFLIGPLPFFDQVADSFTLAGPGPCTIPTIGFTVWLNPGDILETVTVSIYTANMPVFNFLSPPALQFTQTVNVRQAACLGNLYGYDVCTVAAAFSPAAVLAAPGSYYLVLSNATTADGEPVLWDQNGTVAAGNYLPLGCCFYTVVPPEAFSLP